MKKILVSLMLIMLTGCAGVQTKINTDVGKVLPVMVKINDITGSLMKAVGPIGIAGLCMVQPEYCAPAKTAYTLALGAQGEYSKLLADAQSINVTPDPLKLATAASTFQTQFTAINQLIVAAGGADNSKILADLNANIAELQAVAAAAPAVTAPAVTAPAAAPAAAAPKKAAAAPKKAAPAVAPVAAPAVAPVAAPIFAPISTVKH
jgi:hypothetical protein